jgi:hypothetical protein
VVFSVSGKLPDCKFGRNSSRRCQNDGLQEVEDFKLFCYASEKKRLRSFILAALRQKRQLFVSTFVVKDFAYLACTYALQTQLTLKYNLIFKKIVLLYKEG